MENTEVVDNARNSASEPSANMDESGDYFAALDRSLNGQILEKEQETTSNPEANTGVSSQNVQSAPPDDLESLKKRYSDSSREAKRLYEEKKAMEPYIPIINAMKEDPNLISHVRGYFQGGGEAPKSMKEQMGLDENFMFDPDEAMSNPESDSAKIFNATVDGIVQQRLHQSQQYQAVHQDRVSKENEFKSRHNLSDTEWNEYKDFARSHKLSFDDILYLKNRDSREANIQKNANESVAKQMQKVQSAPGSLATKGSAEVNQSDDSNLFDVIKGLDSQLESAFS